MKSSFERNRLKNFFISEYQASGESREKKATIT